MIRNGRLINMQQMLKVYFHNKILNEKLLSSPPGRQVVSSCFCRPSAEYLFIASAPKCQIFMSHYSSRYLQQQLGIGLEMWKRFSPSWKWAAPSENLPKRGESLFGCPASHSSPGCRLMTNTRSGYRPAHAPSAFFEIMPGIELEKFLKVVMSPWPSGALPTIPLPFPHHVQVKGFGKTSQLSLLPAALNQQPCLNFCTLLEHCSPSHHVRTSGNNNTPF